MAVFALGKDAIAYRNTATYATPTWTAITCIRDVKVSLAAGEWDASRRAVAWKQHAHVQKEGSVDFNMVFPAGADDGGYEAVRDAFTGGTLLDMAFASAAIASSKTEHFRAEMSVMKFDRNEAIEEGQMIDVTVKPGPSANAPAWTEVT